MKFKLLLVSILIFTLFAKAQNLNDEKIMGEWEAVSVEIPNANDIPQKDALKFIEDAFLGSKFNFKGNKVFKIEFGKTADDRVKELFFIDNQNWVINNNQIQIGTENDGFSSMQISVQEINEKIIFILPMIQLEMKKLSDDQPSKPKVIESKTKKQEGIDYSNIELINNEIDKSQIIDFKDAENPPMAPNCKSKWDVEKRRDCTNKFILQHIMRKFNTDLAAEVGLTGIIKIMIEFIIDTNGKAINITASGGPEIMNQHAIEVIGMLPNFSPATKDGEPINVSCKIPLKFQVQD